MRRVTVVDVRTMFEALSRVAKQVGFDTAGWSLHEGSAYEAYRLCITTRDGERRYTSHPLGDYIGMPAREAYDRLSVMVRTLDAVAKLQRPSQDEPEASQAVGLVFRFPTDLLESLNKRGK